MDEAEDRGAAGEDGGGEDGGQCERAGAVAFMLPFYGLAGQASGEHGAKLR